MLPKIIFDNPGNLWLFILPALLILFRVFFIKIYGHNILLETTGKNKKQFLKKAAIILSLMSLILVLASPGFFYKSMTPDYLLIFDISRSMNVEDCRNENGKPISRLEFAKNSIKKNLPLFYKNSRIGIGIFVAGLEITRNSSPAFIILLPPIETAKNIDDLIKIMDNAVRWDNAWQAGSYLPTAYWQLDKMPIKDPQNIVVISDGGEDSPKYSEQMLEERLMDALPKIKEKISGKVKFFFLGVGQVAPSPVPAFDEYGNKNGYILEPGTASPVLSDLNEKSFQKLMSIIKPIPSCYYNLEKNQDFKFLKENPLLKENLVFYDARCIFALISLILLILTILI